MRFIALSIAAAAIMPMVWATLAILERYNLLPVCDNCGAPCHNE